MPYSHLKTSFFCLLGITLNACVVTYDFPVQDRTAEIHIAALQYFNSGRDVSLVTSDLDPFYYLDAPKDTTYAKLERTIAGRDVPSVNSETPPPQGLYFTAKIFPTPSPIAQLFLVSLIGIPCFSAKGGYLVTYDLYADGKFQKTYHYEIGRKSMTWIALLPFIWMNALTASEEDAFRATTTQFLLDASRDQH